MIVKVPRIGFSRRFCHRLCVVFATLLLFGLTTDATGEVQVESISFGYPFKDGAGYRLGAWLPVDVTLSLTNQTAFDGVVRVQQKERDGDVCFDEAEVHLVQSSDSPASPRRFTLYAVIPPPQPSGQQLVVQVLEKIGDDDYRVVEFLSQGQRVREAQLSMGLFEINDDMLAILSVRNGTIGRINALGSADSGLMFDRPPALAHVAPASLPDRWQGLEMIDALVWDDADPTAITDAQAQSLLEWVRQGGHLILAAGRTAPTLADSPRFGPLLPATVEGVESAADLPAIRAKLLTRGTFEPTPYAKPVTVARCALKPGSRPILRASANEPPLEFNLISQQCLNRGRISFIGASLGELLPEDGDVVKFFQVLLALRPVAEDEVISGTESLFPNLAKATGFTGAGSAFLSLALIFSLLYILGSTFGPWRLLLRRGWQKHNWSAFAAIACLATVISLAAVQSTRGWGRRLEKITVVDVGADERFARAFCYLGLRTTTDSVLDVWLPQNYALASEPEETTGYLKPLPVGTNFNSDEGSFTDPWRYRLRPSRASVEDVRVRATVKQFEGRWAGELEGALRAEITQLESTTVPVDDLADLTGDDANQEGAAKEPEEIITGPRLDGTITNGFPFRLYDCRIIHTTHDLYLGSAYTGFERNKFIYVHSLAKPLEAGATFHLADLYRREISQGVFADVPFKDWGKNTLHEVLTSRGKWFQPFMEGGGAAGGAVEQGGIYEDTLWLLSFLSDGVGYKSTLGLADQQRFSRARVRHFDISDRLDTQTVLFIGFAAEDRDHPGPITLCARSGDGEFKPLPISRGLTLYRVLIPLKSQPGGGERS